MKQTTLGFPIFQPFDPPKDTKLIGELIHIKFKENYDC